jgi:hypothetical protein
MPGMEQASAGTMMFLYLMGAAALFALISILAMYLVQKPHRRGALAPFALALALIPATFAVGAGAKEMTQTFANTAATGSGGMGAVHTGCEMAQGYMRIGNIVAIVLLLIATALSFLTADGRAIADHRASGAACVLWLFLLFVPGLLFGGLHSTVRHANRLALAVVDAREPAMGEQGAERPPIMPIVNTLSRAMYIGILGSPGLAVLLALMAGSSVLLAWTRDMPPSFHLIGRVAMVVVTVLCGVAIALFSRPVALPR